MHLQTVLYLCLIMSIEVFSKNNRIIGGESAEIEEFPYLVSLRLISNNRHICGGTIISERHILTAAHCFYDIKNIKNTLKVQAGSTYVSSSNVSIYNILHAFIYPKFTGTLSNISYLQHDIGILELEQFISFSPIQNKANLPITDITQGEKATLCGWGALFYPAISISNQLQQTPMTVITHDQCSVYLQRVQKEQFCAYEDEDIGGCTGDSGSPLVINNTVIGIHSLVVPCARGVPDIYTRVFSYLSFIRAIIRN